MMDRIRQELEKGGAVVLPTETVYGLFAKALDEKAVDHVYQLKRRPRDKALNLNIASLEDILHFSKHQPSYLQILSAQTYQILVLLDDSLILLDLQPYLTGQAIVALMNWRYLIQLPLIGKVCQPQPAQVNPQKHPHQ